MSKQLVQTVYIPVKKVLSRDIFEYIKKSFTSYASKDYIVSELEKDFKSQEGIFFTQEEYNKHIKEVIENTLKNGAENAEIDYEEEKTYDFTFVNKDSILNTSEETYLKYKI